MANKQKPQTKTAQSLPVTQNANQKDTQKSPMKEVQPKKGTSRPQPLAISIVSALVGAIASAVLGGAYLHFSNYFELLVDKQIDNKLGKAVETINTTANTTARTTNEKLDNLGQRVARIEGRFDERRIQNLSMQPNRKTNATQALEILNTAKKEGTKLDPKVITVAGQEFISAGVASSDPDVWKTGLAFLNYRSPENTVPAVTISELTPVDEKQRERWEATFPVNPKNANFTLTVGKFVPVENAAVFEPINKRLNLGKSRGSEFIQLGGSSGFPGGWKLDGYKMKNVIFKDTEITYDGGPVDMQNVFFVNCTFNIVKKPNGKNFATSVLASLPSTFQSEG